MEEKAKEVAERMKLLASPHRLLVLCILEEGEKTVSELHEQISGIGMSALSQHLAVLKGHQLVASDKRGQNVYYRLAHDRIVRVIHTLKETYCQS